MSTSDVTDEELTSALASGFQQAQQGQWPQAISAVQPLADRGDPVATALTAFWLGNSGQPAAGVDYARRAIEAGIGVGPLAANYAGWTQNDPALRPASAEFFEAAINCGWSVDPFGQAQQAVVQGDVPTALRLLRTRFPPSAREAESSWAAIQEEINSTRASVTARIDELDALTTQAKDRISEDEEAIRKEKQRVADLVSDTTSLVQNVAADNLASEYASRAGSARTRADRWTAATLIVSALAIGIAAAFVLTGLARENEISKVLSKTAIALPLLALAAYLNKFASEERRDARSWTHIELQIRTARPYLGNLSDQLRDDVQAALALRFFPGQSQDPHGATKDVDPDAGFKLVQDARRPQG